MKANPKASDAEINDYLDAMLLPAHEEKARKLTERIWDYLTQTGVPPHEKLGEEDIWWDEMYGEFAPIVSRPDERTQRLRDRLATEPKTEKEFAEIMMTLPVEETKEYFAKWKNKFGIK
jgi:hypothetical protein